MNHFSTTTNHFNSHNSSNKRPDSIHSNSDSLSFVTRIYREQLLELLKTAEKNNNHLEAERYKSELTRISNQVSSSSTSSTPINPSLTPSSTSPSSSTIHNYLQIVNSNKSLVKEEIKKEPVEREVDFSGIGEEGVVDRCSRDAPEDLSVNKRSFALKEEPSSPNNNKDNDSNYLSNDNFEECTSSGLRFKLNHPTYKTSSRQTTPLPATLTTPPLMTLTTGRFPLSPIEVETWERCVNLNTEEIVRRVKELLGEYCISQRVFGEHVLGLSQGSVSDLLARPKPWSMLTLKGREPFVRMKCFLDDPHTVLSLISNHYKLPNDKLLKVGMGGSNSCGVGGGSSDRGIEKMSCAEGVSNTNIVLLTENNSFSNLESPSMGRKRKSSSSLSEELAEAGSKQQPQRTDTPVKKARVSFRDEQKDTLRQVYSRDPYPLHSTIEQLAFELDVGVKTVINWFHNHRMRDKSRFLSSHPSSSHPISTHNPSSHPPSTDNSCHSNDCGSLLQESQSPFKGEDHSCDSSSDFLPYFKNNGINNINDNEKYNKNSELNEKITIGNTERDGLVDVISTYEVLKTNLTDQDNNVINNADNSIGNDNSNNNNFSNNNNKIPVKESSEMNSDNEDDGRKELGKVSKRKSARPQKMSVRNNNNLSNNASNNSDHSDELKVDSNSENLIVGTEVKVDSMTDENMNEEDAGLNNNLDDSFKSGKGVKSRINFKSAIDNSDDGKIGESADEDRSEGADMNRKMDVMWVSRNVNQAVS